MTRAKRKAASERMKAIWAKRKATESGEKELAKHELAEAGHVVESSTPGTGELVVLSKILVLMGELSVAGKQYLVNRFM